VINDTPLLLVLLLLLMFWSSVGPVTLGPFGCIRGHHENGPGEEEPSSSFDLWLSPRLPLFAASGLCKIKIKIFHLRAVVAISRARMNYRLSQRISSPVLAHLRRPGSKSGDQKKTVGGISVSRALNVGWEG
jgi:hypothetical protein